MSLNPVRPHRPYGGVARLSPRSASSMRRGVRRVAYRLPRGSALEKSGGRAKNNYQKRTPVRIISKAGACIPHRYLAALLLVLASSPQLSSSASPYGSTAQTLEEIRGW